MKIDTFKDFEKLVKLCQKNGIKAITVDGITMTLEAKGRKQTPKTKEDSLFPEEHMKVPQFDPNSEVEQDVIKEETLTQDQLLMWSAQGSSTETTEVQ